MKSVTKLRPYLLLLLSAVVCLGCCHARATYTGDINPTEAVNTLSSNWLSSARAALPAKYLEEALTFEHVTNLLCHESQRGNRAAQGLWGFALVTQGRSPETRKAGVELLRSSGKKGWVPAMLQLGFLFEQGIYVTRDYNEAFHWFSVASEGDDPEARLQLGGCYHYGLGTTQDVAMAAKCYRRSAEQTNYVAMKSLGYLLMGGPGVGQDFKAARYWLTRAAKEGGNRRAMYNLGA